MKKGQIAIEYLTTYGWAILLLIIVVAIIANSFSPSFLIAEQCNIDKNNLPCNSQVYNDGDDLVVTFKVNNGFGYPIKIVDNNRVNVTMEDGTIIDVISVLPSGTPVDPGDDITVKAILVNGKKSPNSLVTVNVAIEYISCAHEINPGCADPAIGVHTKTGKIVGRVMVK